jgi:hypothetical protein
MQRFEHPAPLLQQLVEVLFVQVEKCGVLCYFDSGVVGFAEEEGCLAEELAGPDAADLLLHPVGVDVPDGELTALDEVAGLAKLPLAIYFGPG